MKRITLIIVLFFVVFLNAQEKKYPIKNISSNTKYSDFGVNYYCQDSVVFASTRKDKVIGNRLWNTNKQPFLELYKGAISEDGDITNIQKFSKVLNTKYHESNVTFTKDLKTVYFSRNNYLNKKFKKDSMGMNLIQLYKAQIGSKGEWVAIEPMPFNSDHYQTGHPVLNAAEDKLYFVSDMPGSLGLTDIYVVDINTDGTYGTPKNLGTTVNTSKSELFPYIDKNDILYYSSNGFEDSKGDLDVYATKLRMNNSYYIPQNIGAPINSDKDDFGIVFQKNNKSGYFSSNRDGGKGDDDIYFFRELSPIRFNCSEQVKGVVKNKATGNLLPGSLVTLYDADGNKIERVVSDTNAMFSFKLNCDTAFKVIGSTKNYKEGSKGFITSDNIHLELNLIPDELTITRGHLMVNINPIYFDFDSSFIRKAAAIELDKVVEVMNKYPELKIEGGSHTDSRGKSSYNKRLSARRAVATIEYIISKGIDKNRLSAKGYGETQLVNKCSNGVKCTKKAHQLNRRTVFVIVDLEADKKQ